MIVSESSCVCISSPLSVSGLLTYQTDDLALKSPPIIRLGIVASWLISGLKVFGTVGDDWGGMYMFTIVSVDLLPVRIRMDWVSVVLSVMGRRFLIVVLVSTKQMDWWIRVMSPPPLPSVRSCLTVV